MSILRAYILPHPPLAVPEVGRGKERGIQKTLAAFDAAAREIAALAPETLVFVTPHNVMYADYFHISPGGGAAGDLSRFGAPETRFETEYDAELAGEIAALAEADGLRAGGLGEKDARLDHGVTVPMWFINRRCTGYRTVRVSQSGLEPSAHYRLGQCIARAAERLGRGTVLIASGDLSHKLSPDAPYGFAEEGAVFDKAVTQALSAGDFLSLLSLSEDLRERAAECGYNSCVTLAGCFDRRRVEASLLSYEGPFGVGYAAAAFAPGEPDESRDVLELYEAAALAEARRRQNGEDPYRALARLSLEHTVRTGKPPELPDGLPEEMRKTRAGTFVSLHKHGRLRGCIGTIAPVTACVGAEIIQNAVSAGLHDSRFEPVEAAELPYLSYKVDILSAPEPVSGLSGLDAKRYGVIVSAGGRRGLLLPNLDGVDTVEEQVAIARRKAGIPENAPVKLERFEVTRHE
ncbi:MAG: AmmeMemoRadiSam system protein A [Oscillospiraceae bacterium]|nr:AmmeMemoRadiSam system protein A [Oscillospiraceae bacterium]